MNPFKLGKEEEEQAIVDAVKCLFFGGAAGTVRTIPARKVLRRRILERTVENSEIRYFQARPFEPQSNSSLLLVEVLIRSGENIVRHQLLARREVFELNPVPQFALRIAANFIEELHHPKYLHSWLLQYTKRRNPRGRNWQRVREISSIPRVRPGVESIHLQLFHPDTVSLFSYLQTLTERECLNEQDRQVLNLVSAKLQRIHSLRDIPVSQKDVETRSLDSFDRRVLDDAYDNALTAWQAHLLYYKRPRKRDRGSHPVWTRELRERFLDTMEALADRFAGRGDRLVITHGDLWSPNILLAFVAGVCSKVEFVDYHRVPYFDRGYDLGRVLFDGLQLYYNTRKPIYLEWNKELLATHQRRTGDAELRETVCFGLISRIFPNLHPESARDFNAERILWLCKAILTMAEHGRYELQTLLQ